MDDATPHSSLSDISGNLFAALIIVVLALSSGMGHARPPSPSSDELASGQAVTRKPLSAAAMVAMLYDRRPSAPGLSLDLTDGAIVLTASGRAPLRLRTADGGLAREVSAAVGAGGVARLYVFRNDRYAEVASALRAAGAQFQEISPPQALRGAALTDWSPAFLSLLHSARDFPSFKKGLARLLAAGNDVAGRRPGAAVSAATGGDIVAALRRAWRRGLLILGVSTPLLCVFAIELTSRATARAAR